MNASIALAAMVTAMALASQAHAAGRLDFYDTKGRRTGYAIVDREAGRVDYYDAHSRRTGYGQVAPDGRVDRFDLKGRREEPHVVPPHVVPPPPPRR